MSSDPAQAADQVARSMRDLADAGRHIQPKNVYSILAAVHASVGSLHQVLRELANWHDTHADLATVDIDRQAGRQHTHDAATLLRDAAEQAATLGAHLDAAWATSGRITWRPDRQQPQPRQVRQPRPPSNRDLSEPEQPSSNQPRPSRQERRDGLGL